MHSKARSCRPGHRTVVACAALVVALGAMSYDAAVANAAFPGRNGRISYVANSSPSPLVSVRPRGGHDRVLLRNGFVTSAYSPDGRTIVFERASGAGSSIYIKQVLGRPRLRRLTRPFDPSGRIGGDAAPNWSPDGRSVVFVRSYTFRDDAGEDRVRPPATGPCAGAEACIRIYHRGRTRAVGAVRDAEPQPVWSVRNRIAFSEGFSGRISVIRPDGSGRRRLVIGDYTGHGMDWSPDGRRLVFTSGERLVTVGADGRHLRRLGRDAYQPAFSPDGRRIVFLDLDADDKEQLRTVDLRGHRLHIVRTRYEMFHNYPGLPLDWQPLPRRRHR
jgi:Tol biopolymer transport system component